ncbi:MAG: hypothetical protein NVSMB32_15610 [Actinomycetota bacterium]
MRHNGDRGAIRHVMLIALVGGLLVLGLHWGVRVSCLFQNISNTVIVSGQSGYVC